jgi:hypothetical protein
MPKKHLLSLYKKKCNPTKRSHVAKQNSESYSSFAPEDDDHEDNVMEDVDSTSPTVNLEIQRKASLSARKTELNHQVDKKIHALEKDHKTIHIMIDDLFHDVFQFMLAIKKTSEALQPSIMKQYPNKLPYKWIKKYDLMTVKTSNILIFKQEEGDALDSAQEVVHYSKIFDVLRDIHEAQAGNDHPKSRTLYRRVCARYGKSIPRWICELFPLYCPVCVRSKPHKKPKAGHQPLLTREMNVHV